MNLKQLLQHFTVELQGIYDAGEIASIFYITTDHISGYSRSEVRSQWSATLLPAQYPLYLKVLEELKSGKPIQYILGETVFYGLPFKVNPSVLIPRPETEELVEWIIERYHFLDPASFGLQIIDIGTGSGCIAISLKKNLSASKIFALDISEQAIETAMGNAILNQIDINFVKADIKEFISEQKFDIIVSNPPYITLNEKEEMQEHVLKYEPHLALFVSNEKPLVFYEAIADFAKTSLNNNGILFFEINAGFGKETIQMLKDKSFTNIRLKKDMQGKDRMICCSLG